jgi:hypothetical protein
MKSNLLVPAATALLGFSLAWIAKPTATTTTPEPAKAESVVPTKPPRLETNARPTAGTGKRPVEVKAGDFPLADQFEKGPKTSEEAKLLRLSEALGLNFDQQSSVIQLIADTQATANKDIPALEDLANRGKVVDEGLRKILTPEQYTKFQEIQTRQRENRTEARAQIQLAEAIEFIDLSPEQREEVASRLRQKAKADLQAIPAAATLLFSKSILPSGGSELGTEGALLLNKMGEKVTMGDPMEIQQNLMNRQKQELEDMLKCFDGILTSAQMGQYQASIAEKRATMNRISEQVSRIKPPPVSPAPVPEQ